uniref:Serine/threonine-protein kinase receptor n=1 Tax=Monopterus albus TaxID=43700 RepID=A0A3Q3JS06_MONAL
TGSGPGAADTTECLYYYMNYELERTNRSGVERCHGDPDKCLHCYASWMNESGAVELVKMGCWLDDINCYDRSSYIVPRFFFCCCEGNFCNKNFTHLPEVTETRTNAPLASVRLLTATVSFLLSAALLSVALLATVWTHRHRKPPYGQVDSWLSHNTIPPPAALPLGLKPLQLLEVKARGCFGCIWKAQILNDYVAVKIFPIQVQISQQIDQSNIVFALLTPPHLPLGTESGLIAERGTSLWRSLWHIQLVGDPGGSLSDFLKGNVLGWSKLCHVSESMAHGLAYLHEDVPPQKGIEAKPAIAHRDFKSKNILLRLDLTVVITDFGLAICFEPGNPPGVSHGQVSHSN